MENLVSYQCGSRMCSVRMLKFMGYPTPLLTATIPLAHTNSVDSRLLIGASVPVKHRRDRSEAARFAVKRFRRGMASGTGGQGTAGLSAFARSEVENRRPADGMWIDGTCVVKAEATQRQLRRDPEAVSGEACFGEHMAFDIVRHVFLVLTSAFT